MTRQVTRRQTFSFPHMSSLISMGMKFPKMAGRLVGSFLALFLLGKIPKEDDVWVDIEGLV